MSVIEPKGVVFHKSQTEYQLFPEEYFTGTDVNVYFNDVWIDELTGLSFALKEITNPIYGYASHTWDYIGRGKRLVQGQFRIAFKEAGYLFTIFDHIGRMGNHKKTGIGWLMNEEQGFIPDWYGGVTERIEDVLKRIWGDPNKYVPPTIQKQKQTKYFKWPVPMKLGDSDSDPKMKMDEERYGYTTAVRQLQAFLKKKGYTWNPVKFKWGKYYAGDTWRKSTSTSATTPVKITDTLFQNLLSAGYINSGIGKNKGDWYMILRFWPAGNPKGKPKDSPIDTIDAYSTFEAELQNRLDNYPGKLKGFYMGGKNGQYDGRFGQNVREGLKKFMELAEINDGSNGYYVTTRTKEALEAGFAITGKYDVPTKVAVWLYQQDMIAQGRLKKAAPDGIVDKATMDTMTEDVEVEVVVPGESKYRPENLAESLSAFYEKEIWGRPWVQEAEAVRGQESFFYRSRRNEKGEKITAPLEQGGFDIYINYGPLPQYIQSKLNKITKDVSFNTTVKAIRNVQITDVEQVLDAATGQPIEEIYTFIARDLD